MLSFVLLLNGCATLTIPAYEVQSINHYTSLQIRDGLAVAMRPLTDPKESKQYFGTNLLAADVLAILVVAENRNPSSSFLLSKDQLALRAGETAAQSTSGRDEVRSEAGGQAMMLAGAALISLPLLFGGAKIASDANVIQHNFAVKELQTQTLSPGESTHGFVYFRVAKGTMVSDQWTVQLAARELGSNNIERFDFPFVWRKE
jgi:hypothetical protein